METEQFFNTLRMLRENGKSFSSHDFIKCFSKNYQREFAFAYCKENNK